MNQPTPTALPLPNAISLKPDEIQVAVWKPNFSVFLVKLTFMSSLTALLLGNILRLSFNANGVLLWTISFLVSAAVYAFIFDDVFEWRQRRDDRWVLTSQRVIFYNPSDDESPATVPLAAVKKVRRWMFWGVQIKLLPRDAVTMLFLKNRKIICHTLRETIAKHRDTRQDDVQSETMT